MMQGQNLLFADTGVCNGTEKILFIRNWLCHPGVQRDFMFLYRFVRRRRRHRRLQNFVHVIKSEQFFVFLSFLVGLNALTFKLPD